MALKCGRHMIKKLMFHLSLIRLRVILFMVRLCMDHDVRPTHIVKWMTKEEKKMLHDEIEHRILGRKGGNDMDDKGGFEDVEEVVCPNCGNMVYGKDHGLYVCTECGHEFIGV
jgi:hypothetical protein